MCKSDERDELPKEVQDAMEFLARMLEARADADMPVAMPELYCIKFRKPEETPEADVTLADIAVQAGTNSAIREAGHMIAAAIENAGENIAEAIIRDAVKKAHASTRQMN